ncbi:hypothetical protein [Chitinophaga sp. 212800010-3]|uniref:LolA family protein n=1 Tax=unclassified Chitinophaga TaxID=2619133 RepID=UPI002DF39346|nr:Outer membrane lipoprotein-sorting protein [Chitinophaga sp. 212800010-3]
MIRTKFLAFLTGVLLAGIGAYAQSVDDILSKNTEAMGGNAKLKGLKTQYIEGNMEVQGQTIPIKRWVKQDEGMRLEFNVMGANNIQVVTSGSGWTLMPVMMQTEPQDMDAATAKLMKSQLDLRGELYDYKSKGKKIELAGKDTVNGAPAYKLKIISEDGKAGYAFLDAKTFFVVKILNNVNIKGQDLEVVTLLSDYRKTSEGLAYPGTTLQQPGDVKINIIKIDHNVPVADSLFAKPAK